MNIQSTKHACKNLLNALQNSENLKQAIQQLVGGNIPMQDNMTLWTGYTASAWFFLFAAVSFYWAAGGRAGVDTIGDVITKPTLAGDPMMVTILWDSGIVRS